MWGRLAEACHLDHVRHARGGEPMVNRRRRATARIRYPEEAAMMVRLASVAAVVSAAVAIAALVAH
ncbi:hypothetical protein QOZ94_004296 [Xanthobacter agilis]|uniref:Uncharacterized protein n=1 Tax=Xanthobacter agilis TaxID=47492 RepID=A0ABU0LK03_XANAG|nr:hypothetical protein [Xanthobacter agilis]